MSTSGGPDPARKYLMRCPATVDQHSSPKTKRPSTHSCVGFCSTITLVILPVERPTYNVTLGQKTGTRRSGTVVQSILRMDNRSRLPRIYLDISPLSLLCGELKTAPLFLSLA